MTIGDLMPFVDTNRKLLLVVSGLFALIVISAWMVGRLSERSLLAALQQGLGSSLDVHASGLLGDLSNYPAALSMLAGDPRILRAVITGNKEDIGSARARLRRYADLSGVESAMIVDADGRLIADQDNDPGSALEIVDWLKTQPAFETALKSGLGRAFGRMGDQGGRRYLFARRITNPGTIPPILIAAVNLDHTELLWRLAEKDILVVDRQGVVLLSSDQRRQFERLRAAPETTKAGLDPRYKACRDGAITRPGQQICLARSIARLGWDIYLLSETASVRGQVRLRQWVTALGLISLALLIGVVGRRRLAWQRTLRIEEDSNRLLQQRADRRTAELEAANQQLQVEIDERIGKERALRDAQGELVQASKLAALGQLSAGIAHQLNQPLAALRAYTDNARTFLNRGQPDPAAEDLSLIGDLTERIGKITKDLKVLARRQPTRTEPVALPSLVRSVIDQIEKGHTMSKFEIVYDERAAISLAEPVGLQQVLANLIQNGIDAMETAGGQQQKTLSITTSTNGDRVRLSVADRGTGIDPAHMERIFDPFFTTKEVGKGLGLGLSLSASMVQDMGGRLSVSNRNDGGACFTIDLKRAEEEGLAA